MQKKVMCILSWTKYLFSDVTWLIFETLCPATVYPSFKASTSLQSPWQGHPFYFGLRGGSKILKSCARHRFNLLEVKFKSWKKGIRHTYHQHTYAFKHFWKKKQKIVLFYLVYVRYKQRIWYVQKNYITNDDNSFSRSNYWLNRWDNMSFIITNQISWRYQMFWGQTNKIIKLWIVV